MNARVLHFTLGPVQGFVGEARRLRDFWAGSFLLSWLSGKAMNALVDAGGVIVFPQTDNDPLFKAISGRGGTPHVGSLPNRFKADVSKVTGDPGEICAKAVRDAWQNVADAVWKLFVSPVAGLGSDTKDIWDRQVKQFWEIAWVVGDEPKDGSDSAWLDRRKNWRNHWAKEPEAGDKCRLMGNLQEISGFERLHDAEKQQKFWKAITDQSSVGPLNLREDERLCAIALVKRLFPLLDIIENVIGFRPGGKEFQVVHWPSTSYVAALPWLKVLTSDEHKPARQDYASKAKEHLESGYKGETETRIYGLPKEDFFRLDGHLLHEDGIQTWPEDAFKAETSPKEMAAAWSTLKKVTRLPAPTKFYAMLLMDGDRIGAQLQLDADAVKKGLGKFAGMVTSYFSSGNTQMGNLIYAGGDDVLAVLPVDTAIDAAYDIRDLYDKAFGQATAINQEFTLSGAIVFAHYKVPLRQVMDEAHRQLDDVAKDQNGRNSLSIGVRKPGGMACEWVSCWQLDDDAPGKVLVQLARTMQDAPEYSAGFFHNLRDRYAPLFDDIAPPGETRGFPAQFGEPELMKYLVLAEYARQGGMEKKDAEAATSKFMGIAQALVRDRNGQVSTAPRFSFDAGLVLRFLSQHGRWETGA